MEKTTLRQLRGLNDLVADALDAGVARTEEIHRGIAGYPYAVLKRIGPVASPVRVVEFVETTITGSVYWTLRLATRASGALVAQVLERLDTRAS
jgi:hypothetical protein